MPSRVLRGLVLLLVALLAMEGAARMEDRVRYGTPWFSPYRDQSELLVRQADGMHARPGARFQKWGINSLGFRGPEAPAQAAPGTLRVVTTGASETFGLYEAEGKEYPRQLQDSLEARLPELGCKRVEVLNAAMPGMSLPTVTQDVTLRLHRFAPQVVVYYPTPAQYLDDLPPKAAQPDSSGGPPSAIWKDAFLPRMSGRLREQAKGLIPDRVQDYLRVRLVAQEVSTREAGWRFDEVPADRLRAFEADLRRLVGAVRMIGAEPVLATHANAFRSARELDPVLLHKWERFYPRAPGRIIVAFDEAAAIVTIRVAEDSAVALADLHSTIEPGGFADYAHFDERGAASVAAALSESIVALAQRENLPTCPGGTGL